MEANTDPSAEVGRIQHPEYIAEWRELPDQIVLKRETTRLIETVLTQLADKHRVVFVLRDVEGMSVRETANAMRIIEVNVKVRLLRARLQLREQLTRSFDGAAMRVQRASLLRRPNRTRALSAYAGFSAFNAP
ncbi:MAG: sigma-70 family RNA polymerase sigma factor [Verrucomicrobiales bacterium]|nr:sigma-70 family RNA polymerase sigma factor [Verrucomicrobiales bacterium]